MVSSLTQQSKATTFECLELGAFDFVAKPDGTVSSNMGAVAAELVSKLKAAAASQNSFEQRTRTLQRRKPFQVGSGAIFEKVTGRKAVAIGISTGGPATLQEVLPLIPADVPASLFLVQHMPPAFMAAFARRLDDHCALKVWKRNPAWR
jgi:two-component system, chemotaxis family, protein-glutamate methylesterase/glutaminase